MRWQDFDYNKWQAENDQFDHELFDKAVEEAVRLAQGDLLKWMELVKDLTCPPPHPHARFSVNGDQLEVYLSDVATHTHWLNPQIKLHISEETNEIVGLTISGISGIIEQGIADAQAES